MRHSGNQDTAHTFDNGVKIYACQIMPKQRRRYDKHNLHEPLETSWFQEMIESFKGRGGLFIDVGAAVGYYTIFARLLDSTLRVHAYEPLEDHRRYMTENLALNGMDPATVAIHDQALGAEAGKGVFEVAFDRVGSRLAGASMPDSVRAGLWNRLKGMIGRLAFSTRQAVRVTTFDTVVSDLGEPIDLVKLDIQGGEYDLLSGAAQAGGNGTVRRWLVGTHRTPRGHTHEPCLSWLADRGYEILFENPAPADQPDGLIAAALPGIIY